MSITLNRFFFEIPLYHEVDYLEMGSINFRMLVGLEKSNIYIDGYNPTTGKPTTYTISKPLNAIPLEGGKTYIKNVHKTGGYGNIHLNCGRSNMKFIFFCHLNLKENIIMKVGQYPSLADFQIDNIKSYDKILSKDKQNEFTKAIGLSAHGVGIGSYVYLRRIFEHLIEEAYNSALENEHVSEQDYNDARDIKNKIKLLASYLPDFLVDNKEMYSILSLGIHKLEEEKCLKHFGLLKTGIEMILDEKLEAYNKDKKKEDAARTIKRLHEELSR